MSATEVTVPPEGGDVAVSESASWWQRIIGWPSANRGPAAVLAASLVALAYLVVTTMAERPPLYWDEAVYANRGRFFVGDLDDGTGYWSGYRAPGLPYMMSLIFRVVGVGMLGVRLPAAIFGVAMVLLVFALGRLLLDAWAGAAAAALVVLSFGFTRFTVYGVPDVPGAALGLGAVVAALWGWRRGPLHPGAYVVVPLLAALATYVRFGAPIALGIGLVAAVFYVGLTQLRARRGAFVREVMTLAVVTVAPIVAILYIPFFTAQTTAPLTAQRQFQSGRALPASQSIDESISIIWPDGERFDFFQPLVFFVALVLALIGVLSIASGARFARAVSFCLIGLVLTLVALNLALDHMETRYLIVALPYFAVLVGVGVSAGRTWLPSSASLGSIAAALAVVVAVVTVNQSHDRQIEHAQRLEASFGTIEEAGRRIASLDDCVVISGRAAQVGWYSRCRTTAWFVGADQPVTEQVRRRTQGHDDPATVYVVDIVGHNRQPDSSEFTEPVFVLATEVGDPEARSGLYIRVLRVAPCARDATC